MFNKLSYKTLYLILILTIGFWSTFAYFTLNSVINKQKKYSSIINKAGMQRMLSQKLRIYAEKLYIENRQEDIDELIKISDLMKKNCQFIIANAFSPKTKNDCANEILETQNEKENIISLLTLLINSREKNVLNKIKIESEKVLSLFIENVTILENESDEIVASLKLREVLILIGTIITLLFESLFIIFPVFSKLKNNENLVLNERQKYIQLLQLATDGIHILDNKGNVIICSDSFADSLGYTYKEALKLNVKDWDEFFPKENIIQILNDLIEKKDIFETVHKRKDGSLIDVQVNVQGIVLDGKKYLYASSRNITETKKYRKDLETSYALLKEQKDALDAFAIVSETDLEGTIIYANEKFSKLSKYNADELIGQNHRILNSGFHNKLFFKAMWDKISSGKTWKGLIRNKAKDGSFYWVDSLIFPIIGNNKIMKYVSIRLDVTKRIELEHKLEKALKYKQRFVAELSHEIRTPINLMSGVTDELYEIANNSTHTIEHEINQLVDVLKHTSNHIVEVLNGVLDYSSMEKGKLNIANHVFALKYMLSKTEQLFNYSCRLKKINFSVSGDINHEEVFYGQEKHIRQIIFNVMNNAIKFTPTEGSINLSIEVKNLSDKTRNVIFKIKDSGPGIAKDKISKIFEEFEQENDAVKANFGGSGVGLSVTKSLVEFLKGKIVVDSELGQGTTFQIEIPLNVAENNQIESFDSFDFKQDFLKDKKVLIIDDDEKMEQLYRLYLKYSGGELVFLKTATEVEQLVHIETFDFIIVDYFLGTSSGIDIIKNIKNRNEGKHILISGESLNVEKGLFDLVFLKPIKKKDFLRKLYLTTQKA